MGKRDRRRIPQFRRQEDGAVVPAKGVSVEEIVKMISPRIPKKSLSAQLDGQMGEFRINPTVRLRTVPVAWGFPMDEILYGKWFSNFLDMRPMPWDDTITSLQTYLPFARNFVHNQFLTRSTSPWLVMLDSDVVPPPDFLERLLKSNKPFVSGWYKRKSVLTEPVVYDRGGVDQKSGRLLYKIRTEAGQGIEDVDAVGLGIAVMSRSLAEKLGEDPYDVEAAHGEDFGICEQIHHLGIEVLVDWSIACAHAGVGLV
jgi:hypothetical protein